MKNFIFQNIDLYELSEDLAAYPPQAIDVVLCGLLPMDFDDNWGRPSNLLSQKLLLDKEVRSGEKWKGRIVLALKNILFLDPIQFCETLSEIGVDVVKFNLREKLLKKELAVANEKHLNQLYQLCDKAGISVPRYKRKFVKFSI